MLKQQITEELVVPPDLAEQAKNAGIELGEHEARALIGLLGGVACADERDVDIRYEIITARVRNEERIKVANRHLALNAVYRAVREGRESNVQVAVD